MLMCIVTHNVWGKDIVYNIKEQKLQKYWHIRTPESLAQQQAPETGIPLFIHDSQMTFITE